MFTSTIRLRKFSLAAIFFCLQFIGVASLGAISVQAQIRAYVANLCANTVSVIDTDTNAVIATIPVGPAPFLMAATPDGTRVYVTNRGGNTVSVIDTATNTVVSTIIVGS